MTVSITYGFELLGRFVATYAKSCITVVLVLTVVFGCGLSRFGELNDVIEQFTPIDSRSVIERRVANAFLWKDGKPYQALIFVQAKDGESILRNHHLDAVLALTTLLESHMIITNQSNGISLSYMDLCAPNCQHNDLVYILLRTFATKELRYNPNVKLTYPTMQLLNNRIYLGKKFYGVMTDDSGYIQDIRLVELAFEATIRNETSAKLIKQWDTLLWSTVTKFNEESALLNVVFINDELISSEVRRTGISALPYLCISFLFVFIFTIGSTLRPTWSESTPLIVLVGVLGPILGVIGSFGLLIGYYNLPYQPIVTVSICLVLAVGVDDVFLILVAWRRLGNDDQEMVATEVEEHVAGSISVQHNRVLHNIQAFLSDKESAAVKDIDHSASISTNNHSVNLNRGASCNSRSLFTEAKVGKPEEYSCGTNIVAGPAVNDRTIAARRFGRTMADVGPSITITSLTNALSFATGAFTTTPAIRTFSIFTASAIIVTYFVQIFLFGALLSLQAKRSPGSNKLDNGTFEAWWKSTLKGISVQYNLFIKGTASYLASPFAIVIFVLISAVYGFIVADGWSKMRVDLSADKLFLANSPVLKFRAVQDKYINPEADLVYVFVHKPGDLRKASQLNRIMHMIGHFETADTRHEGSDSTSLWLRPYLDFVSFEREEGNSHVRGLVTINDNFTYKEVPAFLRSDANKIWTQSLDIREEKCKTERPACIKSFVFTTAFRHAPTLAVRVVLLEKWRQIADDFADLNITVYTASGYLCDQMSSVKYMALFTVGTTLLSMAGICCVFIGGFVSVICAVLSVCSVNLGVFGLMALWSIDLDPLALAGLLMAVGFSVDYTAHVSYHFHWIKEKDVTVRLEKVFEAMAWPTLQAGLSSLAAVAAMSFHESYLVQTFVKTVVIVILLGLIHGLILLPILLTSITRFTDFCVQYSDCKRNVIHPTESTDADSISSDSVAPSFSHSAASSVIRKKPRRLPKPSDFPELPLARTRWTV